MTRKSFKVISMILASLFVALTVTSSIYSDKCNIKNLSQSKYLKSDTYHTELLDLYEELCIYSSLYLRNKNSNGEYEGSKYLLAEFKKFLHSNQYKYNNFNDDIELESDKFNFYVSMKNKKGNVNYLTNITDKDVQKNIDSFQSELDKMKMFEKKYNNYIGRYEDNITSDIDYGEGYFYYYPNDFSNNEDSCETYSANLVPIGVGVFDNYGRYAYNYGNEDEIIFYNFKKTEANQYILDDLMPGQEDIMYSDDYNGDVELESLESSKDYKVTELDDSGMTIFITPKKDVLKANMTIFNDNYHKYRFAVVTAIVSTVLAVIFIIYLFIVCGCYSDSERGNYRAKTRFVGKIYTELYFLIMFVVLQVTAILIYLLYSDQLLDSVRMNYLISTLLLLILFVVGFGSVLEVVIKLKTKSFLSDCLIYKFVKWLKKQYHKTAMYKSYCEKSMGTKLEGRSVKITVAMLVAFVLIIIAPKGIPFRLISVICIMIIGICEYRNFSDCRQLNLLSKQIDALAKNEEQKEKIENDSALYNDSKKLEEISVSIKESVEEQIKSERMKIELIANVSHDLKTPLTSIIGYIDLLKKLDLDDEAMSYVKILDKKSLKLKSIVADVFTLAKATSGIDINMEKLDFVMLFNQALADADDKIAASGKKIKTEIKESSAFIMGDGEKLYRVFQNLIDNALNYSMDGTRIFLKIYKKKDNIVFETKNVSSYPIEFTADEIVERFARGDKSRTDGGSGLGLSIAKSFTEACEGTFKIELDGDMFKTIVSMPIIKEIENIEQKENNQDDKQNL